MVNGDSRPEAQNLGAAAQEAKESVVDSARYVKDRVTAPVSGEKSADQDAKDVASQKAGEAKDHGKGMLESLSEGAKYVGSRFTASPSGEEHKHKAAARDHAERAEGEARGFFSRVGNKAQETKESAGDTLEEEKHRAKDKYDETQQTIADKIATNPVEEARAQGQIPADSATVKTVEGRK